MFVIEFTFHEGVLGSKIQNVSNKKLLLCTLEREKFVKCFCPFFDDAMTTAQCFCKVRSKNANYSLHIT